jgi:epsilon-lactone hydrolase
MRDEHDRHDIAAIRALLTSKPRPVGWAERRARIDEVGSAWPVAEDIRLTPVDLGGVPGEFSLAPGSDPTRVLMFFHGGGFCSGSIVSHRRMVTEAGRAAHMRTLAVEYRLAPEHPFPAAHEDALTAWRFVRAQGIAADAIAVGGDSAGGNLTIALINRLRAAGESQPACAWLASPWTDLTMSGASLAAKDAVDPLIHKGYLEELAGAYAGAADRRDPLISPLFSQLGGFPPVLIQVGSAETLLDDAVRFARARPGRRCGDARSLAAHDPCLADVEREAGGRPADARAGGGVCQPLGGVASSRIVPATS